MFWFGKKEKHLDCEYRNKAMLDLTYEELQEFAELYSNNYGYYSSQAGDKEKQRIRYSANMYKKNYCKENYYAAMARVQGRLVGLAVYLRKKYPCGKMTWIVQLVVDEQYQGRRIASTLLQSIWGFSSDYAWGLATTNPCTIRALENATCRRCRPRVIGKMLRAENASFKELLEDIPFVEYTDLCVTGSTSLINSRFFVDYSSVNKEEYTKDIKLGELKPGYEWFAFVFNTQDADRDLVEKNMKKMIGFSHEKLRDAYDRMDMLNQKWASTESAAKEVEVIRSIVPFEKHMRVLDMGCGIGRHSLAMAPYVREAIGIDFSERQLEVARSSAREYDVQNVRFLQTDIIREQEAVKQLGCFDAILCLYDVIGSYPNDEENEMLVKIAYESLSKGGYFVCSVMNMKYTEHVANKKRIGNLMDNPRAIFDLKPSNIMQKTGDIFNPTYMYVDTNRNLVYRKEQFEGDGELPAEYVIRDKRYTKESIVNCLEKNGFHVQVARYVRTGKFGISESPINAKEILVIAQK